MMQNRVAARGSSSLTFGVQQRTGASGQMAPVAAGKGGLVALDADKPSKSATASSQPQGLLAKKSTVAAPSLGAKKAVPAGAGAAPSGRTPPQQNLLAMSAGANDGRKVSLSSTPPTTPPSLKPKTAFEAPSQPTEAPSQPTAKPTTLPQGSTQQAQGNARPAAAQRPSVTSLLQASNPNTAQANSMNSSSKSLPAVGAKPKGPPTQQSSSIVHWVPEPTDWPVVSKDILSILDGAKLERPFTTEQCHEYPTRGYYACVRCRTPIAAALNKLGIEGGYSAFQRLNTVDTEVRVVSGEYSSRLQVSCKKCRGNLGELSQDVPARVKCETGEIFKANSICLHFVDGPVTAALNGNFCAADDDRDGVIPDDDDFGLEIGGGKVKRTPAVHQQKEQHHNLTAGSGKIVSAQQRHTLEANEYSDDEKVASSSESDEEDDG